MPRMRVLLDLDGPLVDRLRALEDWARSYLVEVGAPAEELEWLREADENGYRLRHELAAAIVERLCPSGRQPRSSGACGSRSSRASPAIPGCSRACVA